MFSDALTMLRIVKRLVLGFLAVTVGAVVVVGGGVTGGSEASQLTPSE